MSQPVLPDEIVGIDVETTALDPRQGEIIEVSAIRYRLTPDTASLLAGEETGEFSALTKPNKTLSAQITAITGITPAMVAPQPPFSAIKDDLRSFIGDNVLFAHNASFDTGFLSYYGLDLQNNPIWDTFTLAGIAWPEAPSYNLGMLAEMTGISVASEHRAGDDVRLAWQLLRKIRQQLTVSPEIYQYIQKLLQDSLKIHYLPLFTSPVSARRASSTSDSSVSASPVGNFGDDHRFAAMNLPDILSSHGPLRTVLPGWHSRPEQLAMAQ
ncbi:MAG: 3'-5' exonuclease, partial [Candidatus Andersenbacteria bacterium]|nr:3'-5' exonuclease [Candidatus Andersenbacteria bacterium]